MLCGSGMGGLTIFQNSVQQLLSKVRDVALSLARGQFLTTAPHPQGHKKISPFFIPYAITNMGGALLAMDLGFMGPNYSISTAGTQQQPPGNARPSRAACEPPLQPPAFAPPPPPSHARAPPRGRRALAPSPRLRLA